MINVLYHIKIFCISLVVEYFTIHLHFSFTLNIIYNNIIMLIIFIFLKSDFFFFNFQKKKKEVKVSLFLENIIFLTGTKIFYQFYTT